MDELYDLLANRIMTKITQWFEEKNIFGNDFEINWSYLAGSLASGKNYVVFLVDVCSHSCDIKIDANFIIKIQEELRKDNVLSEDCVLYLYNSSLLSKEG